MPPRVLITDGEYRQALAILRSLGRGGAEVDCMSQYERALCFRSKYCSRRIVAKGVEDAPGLGQQLLDAVSGGEYDVLITVGLGACREAARLKGEMQRNVRVPIAGQREMEIAINKLLTTQLARELGAPVPETALYVSLDQALEFAERAGYPIVVKPTTGSGSRGISFPANAREVELAVNVGGNSVLLLQEFIPGSGFGYSALAKNGEVLADFMHQRIHEYPPRGGPSTLARSIEHDWMREVSRRLLARLNWTGVAMMEFRGNPAPEDLKLLEINPKFWGSLDLAIASGVDFPNLLLRMALDEEIPPTTRYRKNLEFRWTYPDLLYALDTNGVPRYLARFLNRRHLDDLDMTDPGPVGLILRRILGRIAPSTGR